MKKISFDEFVARSVITHGNKYDYHRDSFTKLTSTVTIICPIHGEFIQNAKNHTNGDGCPTCGGVNRMSHTDFVQKSNEIHQHKYDYSDSKFTTTKNKVTIICPTHGSFTQNAGDHVRGKGCKQCGHGEITQSDFTHLATKTHDGKYDYSKVDYVNKSNKVVIICPTHGEFQQSAGHHIAGSGCPKCNGGVSLTSGEFIATACDIHGNDYDYSMIDYTNMHTPITIICPDHGEFQQTPNVHIHLKGGCQQCNGGILSNTEDFIRKGNAVHHDIFDYSLVNYVNQSTLVEIKCAANGGHTFKQTPKKHLAGAGCNVCHTGSHTLTNEEFIVKAIAAHGHRYGYDNVDYHNNITPVTIECPTHGMFQQTPMCHTGASASGCPSCGNSTSRESQTRSSEDMHKLLIPAQANDVGFELFQYTGYHNKITLICPHHGEFTKTYWNALQGQGCPTCSFDNNIQTSQAEKNFLDQLEIHFGELIRNTRNVISPKELDGYFPAKKLAVEYCGLYWHSELMGKSRKYHLDKLKQCNDLGIKLLTVFEDEWINHPEAVINRIGHALHKSPHGIGARQCKVQEITKTEATNFLNTHHLQGYKGCRHRFGLFHGDQLVSVMTFAIPSRAKGFTGDTTGIYEISRFASSINVSGGGSKLLKAFERKFSPNEIFTYADRRWGDGSSYLKMGFEFVHDSPPNYWYFKGQKKRVHRFGLRKTAEDDQSLTEWQNRQQQGWNRIWDCGHRKFIKHYSNGP